MNHTREIKWLLRVADRNIAKLVFPSDDPDGVRIAIEKAETKNGYDIQLNQPRLKIRSDHKYRILFRARADRPRSLFLGFAQAHDPWNGLGLYQKIELISEWQNFQKDFVATADEGNGRIHFDIGESDIPVELSEVVLISLTDDQAIEPVYPSIGYGQVQEDKDLLEELPEHRQRLAMARDQVGRWKFGSKALILMYHRVAGVRYDPWALCVTQQHFAEQLEILRDYMLPLRLQQLTEAIEKGNIPHRSVVVTFDDGYADNFYQARPLLERYEIPATVFITTGYLHQEREFWWNELERVLLEPGTLPATLCLNISGETHSWELNETIDYKDTDCWQYHNWRIWDEAPTSRHSLYCSLWQLLQPLTDSERLNALRELRLWAGEQLEKLLENQPAHRALSPEEVLALAQGEFIDIGSHTVTHPVLSMLPLALQQKEIRQSKASLEAILSRPVTSFAYPYGARCNYTDETVAIVRDAGFLRACSTLEGVVEWHTDCFQLPRVQVQDWDGEEFARRLELWFDGSKKTQGKET